MLRCYKINSKSNAEKVEITTNVSFAYRFNLNRDPTIHSSPITGNKNERVKNPCHFPLSICRGHFHFVVTWKIK